MKTKVSAVLACVVLLSACSSHNAATTAPTTSLGPAATPATYALRVGLAVITGSRTCVAIKNANATISGTVTLVSAMAPQTFAQGEISAASTTPCPISKEVDSTVSSYDLHLAQGATLPKMTPLIAVLGTSAPFSVGANSNVVADLDQNGKTESFRACSAGDGIHVTVWSGNPLEGTLLWHGYYYEPGNTGVGSACTPGEMPQS